MNERLPKAFSDLHPRFRVRGWRELLGDAELIDAPDMARHFIITGETGSGKSVSGVTPLLEGVLRYPEEEPYAEYAAALGDLAEERDRLRPAAFVIDPKRELEAVVRKEAQGRKVTRIAYGEPGPILHLFEGRDMSSLDASAAMDFILQQSDFFVQDQERTREPIWNMQAASLIKDLVAVDMWLAKEGKLAQFWESIAGELEKQEMFQSFTPSLKYDATNYFRPLATLIALSADSDTSYAMGVYLDSCNVADVPGKLTARISTVMSLCHNTRSGVVWMANGILADLSSEEFAACVSLNPIEPPPAERLLSIEKTLRDGDVVVYVPSVSINTVADLIGRCLKSKFFEFVFQREQMERPFFYIVDEAHRFITSGEQDGEQSLLDRCRAYRAGAVLATQSLASMAYRLSSSKGWYALQVILNNCGNALYFRTSDTTTQENLFRRIPVPPVANRPHVLMVRPMTSLGVGSCYALRSNGRWGIFQVRLGES